jgi:hypothetical protein
VLLPVREPMATLVDDGVLVRAVDDDEPPRQIVRER